LKLDKIEFNVSAYALKNHVHLYFESKFVIIIEITKIYQFFLKIFKICKGFFDLTKIGFFLYKIMEKAYVLISCDLGKEEDVLDTLRSIKSVKEVHGTFGAYDIIAEVSSENAEELRKDISGKIRKMPSIRSTLTLIGI